MPKLILFWQKSSPKIIQRRLRRKLIMDRYTDTSIDEKP